MQNADKKFYEKKIVYLDYLERGEKVKNGGHLKWEAKENTSRIEIHIRGLYPTDTLQGEIRLISFEESFPADNIMLHFGAGDYVAQWDNQNLAETKLTLSECDGVMIRLSENRMLTGQWRKREQENKPPQEAVVVPKQGIPQETTWEQTVCMVTEEIDAEAAEADAETSLTEAADADTEVAVTLVAATEESVAETPLPEEETAKETVEEEIVIEEIPETKKTNREANGEVNKEVNKEKTKERTKETVLVSDKWEQLNCYYPKIHPFGDKREYLSITPRDFVVLSGKYHNLVHNSFLLHGYYNYGHVVLAKLKEGQEDMYYLGVPGVYFDREKQAALMFGFEGFEADSDKVTDGGFGYYMKKVEI